MEFHHRGNAKHQPDSVFDANARVQRGKHGDADGNDRANARADAFTRCGANADNTDNGGSCDFAFA